MIFGCAIFYRTPFSLVKIFFALEEIAPCEKRREGFCKFDKSVVRLCQITLTGKKNFYFFKEKRLLFLACYDIVKEHEKVQIQIAIGKEK